MPNIAIFHSTFTKEKEIRDAISMKTGFSIIDDQHIIDEAGKRFSINPKKIEKALYKQTSVFNRFTLERETFIAYVKSVLADHLTKSQHLYFGFITTLIPSRVTHVLKVLLADSKDARIERATRQGMSLKEAERTIKENDSSALNCMYFLYSKDPWDARLYDIVIPVSEKTTDDIAQLVTEQCAQGAVLETEASAKAITDMAISAKAELALLNMGHKVDIELKDKQVFLHVNKSVINFNALRMELQEIVTPIVSPYEVDVRMGKDYADSIYRGQEFKLPPKVLLVDDEKDFVLTLSERLMSRNVGSFAVYDGQEALEFLTDEKPDVMVLDLKMPGIDGLDVLKQTRENNPDIEIIILTGHGSEEDKKKCLELGAFAYLQKPTNIQTLSATIHDAHEKVTSLTEQP